MDGLRPYHVPVRRSDRGFHHKSGRHPACLRHSCGVRPGHDLRRSCDLRPCHGPDRMNGPGSRRKSGRHPACPRHNCDLRRSCDPDHGLRHNHGSCHNCGPARKSGPHHSCASLPSQIFLLECQLFRHAKLRCRRRFSLV